MQVLLFKITFNNFKYFYSVFATINKPCILTFERPSNLIGIFTYL